MLSVLYKDLETVQVFVNFLCKYFLRVCTCMYVYMCTSKYIFVLRYSLIFKNDNENGDYIKSFTQFE
jgi:hypothetical protein